MKPEQPATPTEQQPESGATSRSADGLGIERPKMKTFVVAVVVWIVYPPKHWWSDSTSSTGLTQHIRKAETAEIAEALATHYAIEDWKKTEPKEARITLKHLRSWDITDRLKDA